jgi:hypothetical protein
MSLVKYHDRSAKISDRGLVFGWKINDFIS